MENNPKKQDKTEKFLNEENLKEEKKLRKEKIKKIKEMIEKGEYEVPIEEVVEKILKFLKENR